jgi:hypothetical protein
MSSAHSPQIRRYSADPLTPHQRLGRGQREITKEFRLVAHDVLGTCSRRIMASNTVAPGLTSRPMNAHRVTENCDRNDARGLAAADGRMAALSTATASGISIVRRSLQPRGAISIEDRCKREADRDRDVDQVSDPDLVRSINGVTCGRDRGSRFIAITVRGDDKPARSLRLEAVLGARAGDLLRFTITLWWRSEPNPPIAVAQTRRRSPRLSTLPHGRASKITM